MFGEMLRSKLGLLIISSLLRNVLAMENSISYHDSILHSMSIHNINGSSSGIPLFELKMDLHTSHAICFPNSTQMQLVFLSVTICRQLGYDALQRVYPIDAHLLDNTFHGKGLVLNVNCSRSEPDLHYCRWKYPEKTTCQLYLGVRCTECNYKIDVMNGKKQEIELPVYLPCLPHAICEWIISNNHLKREVIILEFKKKNMDRHLSNTKPFVGLQQRLEIRWFDVENGIWSSVQDTFSHLISKGQIRIKSNNITLRYLSWDCDFDPAKILQRDIISVKYYNEESAFFNPEESMVLVPILSCTMFLVFILILISCTCCYIKKREQKLYNKHAYTLTYTPGLDVTYEVEERLTGTWPDVYQCSNLEDQRVHLSSVFANDVNSSFTSSRAEVSSCQCHVNTSVWSAPKFLQSIRDSLLPCLKRKSTCIPESLLNTSSVKNELDDSSFVTHLAKFDSLILSFQWSDSTGSLRSENMVDAGGNSLTSGNQMIDAGRNKTLDFCSGQLLPDTKTAPPERLRKLVSQLATTEYKMSSLDKQKFKSEEDVFSCSSGDTLHSYHSIYPLTHSESFISIASDSHNRHSVETYVDKIL